MVIRLINSSHLPFTQEIKVNKPSKQNHWVSLPFTLKPGAAINTHHVNSRLPTNPSPVSSLSSSNRKSKLTPPSLGSNPRHQIHAQISPAVNAAESSSPAGRHTAAAPGCQTSHPAASWIMIVMLYLGSGMWKGVGMYGMGM